MCTWNGERYLREQLSSIAAQTVQPSEMVICDDGSTDGTPGILQEFAATVAFRVTIVRNDTNLGVTKNFEKAIGLCVGDLIALADQDDVWHANKLEKLSARLEQDPSLGGVFSDAELIDKQSKLTGESLWQVFGFGRRNQETFESGSAAKLLCRSDFVTGATMMLRAWLRQELLPIDSGWIHDGWLTWMLVLHSRLGFLPEQLMGYRVHSAQQAGIPPRSLKARLAKLRRSAADDCAQKANRFAALEANCRARRNCSEETMNDIRKVVELCRIRANLPPHVIRRGIHVFAKLPLYREYTNRGVRAALRDVLLN